jgi:3-hydroxy acid dehydrogenase/malonic semialdehyde reductase
MIILVTGATAGFGESITRRFIENGHKVIATGRRQERLQELKDELGDNLFTAQVDVRNRAAIEEMLANLPAEWKEIDVLVNNAGLALGLEPAHKANVDDWETMIDTNNKGLVYMTRACCRAWWNAIAVISSTSVRPQGAGRMLVVTSMAPPKRLCVSSV